MNIQKKNASELENEISNGKKLLDEYLNKQNELYQDIGKLKEQRNMIKEQIVYHVLSHSNILFRKTLASKLKWKRTTSTDWLPVDNLRTFKYVNMRLFM